MQWKLRESSGRMEVLVSRLEDLIGAWKAYGPTVRYRMSKPLSDSQLRRLPPALHRALQTGDSVEWLEQLYDLRDEREERA
ncbi:MAG TPA: hypothetical protein VK716_05225 [Terracidiphilus sp.]|jgi:hypothetical protein|nr:hypothetical protein [Terracidiphilus sp.]